MIQTERQTYSKCKQKVAGKVKDMYYFMSDIHGNAKAYFALKNHIDFDCDDKLFVLGNIFDGNSEHPEHCLAILDDIMQNKNITLILGDHEYAHTLYHWTAQTEGSIALERKVNRLEPSGQPLLSYMKTLPREKLDEYISYLLKCELSGMVKIGERYFYLVHGAPVRRTEVDDIDLWQESVASRKIDLKHMYQKEIEEDPNNLFGGSWKYDDTIIICGNMTNEDVFTFNPEIKRMQLTGEHINYQRVILYDNKMLLNCGCRSDKYRSALIPTLACVSIDETGYCATYKYDIFSN